MPFGLIIKKRKYVLGVMVWALSTYFVVLTINYFYGKHMLIITFIVFLIGWFITILWMLITSNSDRYNSTRSRAY